MGNPGSKSMKPVIPPKPKGKNPPSVVYKRDKSMDTKVSGGPVGRRNRVEPTGEQKQVGAFVKKTKPATQRRGGK